MIVFFLFGFVIMIIYAFIITEGIKAIWNKLFGKKPMTDDFVDF